MDLKWFFLILLNWIATTTTTKWTSKQDEILNKDFLFPDQEQTLRKEVFKKENLRTKKNRGLLVRLNNKIFVSLLKVYTGNCGETARRWATLHSKSKIIIKF